MTPATVTVDRLQVGDRGRPLFLGTATPHLSWSVGTTAPGWVQAGVVVEAELDEAVTTAHLDGSSSQRVGWPFRALRPYEEARVRVTVRGVDGSASEPSAWVTIRTGPLTPSDWEAPFITAAAAPGERGTIRLRTSVTVPDDLVQAVLSTTAHGVYEAVVDGAVVGDQVLAPGWTAYDDVLTFQTHDVTALLRPGRTSVLGATVADGWFGERYGFHGDVHRRYAGPLAFSAQLRMVTADGRVTLLVTGEDWEATTTGPVTSASIYQGEEYDARLEDDGLTDPAAPLPDAALAVLVDVDPSRLVPASDPPVRTHEHVPVQQVLTSPSGRTILDFGQNLVGWLHLRAQGPAGHMITLRHAEVLEHGELGVRPLRAAAATDRWTLAGSGTEEWSPRFTFHGFRYAEITGWPGDLDPSAIQAVVVHSDMERTGDLVTGDQMLDQLHRNVVWGMRGNFLSVPTDCPQRDERLGWTGDIQVFAPTASYLYDTTAFLASWLRDLAADQARNGGVVPFVVPNALPFPAPPAAAWGDAATLVPTTLWERYADRQVLEDQYDSMRAWVEAMRTAARAGDDELWTGGMQFGDWLDPAAPPDDPARARTDSDIVASAYYVHSTRALARAAGLVGREDDATTYGALAEHLAQAFSDTYITPGGRMVCDAQTAYSLAIVFDLAPDRTTRDRLGDRLAELVRAHGYRIGTGFVGTPIVLDALTATGHLDTAYRLLQQEECPSWLYPITMGATTVWERWDSMLPDGSINPGEMTSFNHYALGAVADWMHRVIGGIAPGEPGYAVVDIAPRPGGRVRRARATLDTGYGTVEVSWTWEDGTFRLRATVPPNSSARVHLPGSDSVVEVGSGRHDWTVDLPEPEVVRPPVDLDSPMSVVADDDEARTLLLQACADAGYAMAAAWSDQGRWRSDTSVRNSLLMISPRALEAVERALAELPDRRTPVLPRTE